MAVIIDIADAVVAELNAHAIELIDGGFTAVRHYRPVFDLREMNVLHVTVVPRGVTTTPVVRDKNQHDMQVDVAVQQRVNETDNVTLDGLMSLVERIGNFFNQRRLVAMPTVMWLKTENKPIFAPEHLEQFRGFTSVLTLTYRVVRPGPPGPGSET